jgi:gentisate 1,2-dioxygenase
MRVYTTDPDNSKGELSGSGRKLVTHQGEELWPVQRVAFDGDADEGMATVTVLVLTSRLDPKAGRVASGFVLDPEVNGPAQATIRAWVRLLPPGVASEPDAGAILTVADDGRVVCLPGAFFEPRLVEVVE